MGQTAYCELNTRVWLMPMREAVTHPELKRRIREICETRVRYGYRRVYVVLDREGWEVSIKMTGTTGEDVIAQSSERTINPSTSSPDSAICWLITMRPSKTNRMRAASSRRA